jgi:hypothetical protein
MVIVVVGNENGVDQRDVLDLARRVRKTLRSEHVVWPAALFENWVKENTETTGEFHIVAGMSKPCCAEV